MSHRRVLTACCALALGVLLLGGCAHHLSVMRGGNQLVISGKSTASDSQDVAAGKMLRLAARMTLDHGYRYFTIEGAEIHGGLPAVRPGANLTIRLYRPGEGEPNRAGLWDAVRIASSGS